MTLLCAEKTDTTLAQSSAFTYRVCQALAEVDAALWDATLPADNLLMSRAYMKALAESTGSDLGYRYLIIERNGTAVALGFFQIVTFKGSNVIIAPAPAGAKWWTKLGNAIKSTLTKLISPLRADLLVSGNTFITG